MWFIRQSNSNLSRCHRQTRSNTAPRTSACWLCDEWSQLSAGCRHSDERHGGQRSLQHGCTTSLPSLNLHNSISQWLQTSLCVDDDDNTRHRTTVPVRIKHIDFSDARKQIWTQALTDATNASYWYDTIRQKSLTWTQKPSVVSLSSTRNEKQTHIKEETKTNNTSAHLVHYRLRSVKAVQKETERGKDLWKRRVLSLEWNVEGVIDG